MFCVNRASINIARTVARTLYYLVWLGLSDSGTSVCHAFNKMKVFLQNIRQQQPCTAGMCSPFSPIKHRWHCKKLSHFHNFPLIYNALQLLPLSFYYYWNNTSIANGCRKLIRFCSLICNLLGNLMKFPIISTNFRYFPVLFLYCQFDPCQINDSWRFIDKSKDFCQFMQIFWLIDW